MTGCWANNELQLKHAGATDASISMLSELRWFHMSQNSKYTGSGRDTHDLQRQ
jgi:hypothetical protein